MRQIRTMHLFAGAGGGILGDTLLEHRPVCAVEIEKYPQKILLQRQADGILPWFPIFGDIKKFDGKPWRGAVDLIAGGFPCQDISAAGKGAGIDGEKSGLWHEVPRVVCEVNPKFIYLENSPMLTIRGLDRVLADLATLGYNARWCVLGADAAGAPHKRERIWILAYSKRCGLQEFSKRHYKIEKIFKKWTSSPFAAHITAERIYGLPDTENIRRGKRITNRMDRLKAIGNAQVPAVCAFAFLILSEGLIKEEQEV